ncbi:uncharacterized protein RCC_08209 [Ramularia collo-cygni]|uniref:RlpA-like protein double-psi beta-barrel domain-containing protein n=1 Tax=Ramularia collo-cygni TaxID=112498 RepID=A0A2D3VA51_9PEZI|nr:uncharacterized protein RCC_08209 [Ramularia collo-cygni]CZT22340.1 uncharacterized protein RCC_08209 [Ramularia collo-cygni]
MQFLAIATLFGLAVATPMVEKRGPTHNGIATYYTQNGNAGSCGEYHNDGDYIVAISQQKPFTYNAHCGQTVTIKNTGGGGGDNHGVGRTINARVVDTCPECDPNHLDLSTGAFKALAGELQPLGQFNIEWHLN